MKIISRLVVVVIAVGLLLPLTTFASDSHESNDSHQSNDTSARKQAAEQMRLCIKAAKLQKKDSIALYKKDMKDFKDSGSSKEDIKAAKQALREMIKSQEEVLKVDIKSCHQTFKENTHLTLFNDVKRVRDIRQLASAFELYYNDNNTYPAALSDLVPTDVAAIPVAPTPPGGNCSQSDNAYTYTRISATSYALTFCLGKDISGLSAGKHTVSEKGIQ
jgi:hypothetical protein